MESGKYVLTILLVMVSIASVLSAESFCSLAPETGRCKAHKPRFYYDQATGTCQDFIYGGCGGNQNNFVSHEDCLEACEPDDICTLPSYTGHCRAYLRRYFFDQASGECQLFTYGGCNANKNNFETLDQCEAACPAGGAR